MASASTAGALILPPPNFHELLTSVSLQSWIPPSMPGQTSPMGSMAPLAPSTPAPGPSPNPRQPTVPGGTAGGSGDGAEGSARQYEVRNNNLLPDIAEAMRGRSFQLRTLFGRGRPPPQHADGQPMCCTYHLRERCSNTCNRAYSHRQLTNKEKTTLRTFVTERIVTPDVGRTSTPPGAADSSGSSS